MFGKVNESIRCTATQCKHHAGSQDYCSLSCITVGADNCNSQSEKCTDCLSFDSGK